MWAEFVIVGKGSVGCSPGRARQAAPGARAGLDSACKIRPTLKRRVFVKASSHRRVGADGTSSLGSAAPPTPTAAAAAVPATPADPAA